MSVAAFKLPCKKKTLKITGKYEIVRRIGSPLKYDMPVDLDEIVNLFQGLYPRMMQLSSLLYEYSCSELVSKWPQYILVTLAYSGTQNRLKSPKVALSIDIFCNNALW